MSEGENQRPEGPPALEGERGQQVWAEGDTGHKEASWLSSELAGHSGSGTAPNWTQRVRTF